MGFSIVIRNSSFLGGDGEVFIPVRAAIEDADMSDLHNCTICMF